MPIIPSCSPFFPSCAKPITIMNRRKSLGTENGSDVGSAAAGIPDEAEPKFSKEDVAKSLLYAICNNISQIAFLNAMRFNIERIFFAGYFIRDHSITMSSISFGIRYWSGGKMSALFLKHEGYLGAIGSFFKCFTSRSTSASPVSPSRTKHEGDGEEEEEEDYSDSSSDSDDDDGEEEEII